MSKEGKKCFHIYNVCALENQTTQSQHTLNIQGLLLLKCSEKSHGLISTMNIPVFIQQQGHLLWQVTVRVIPCLLYERYW